VTKPSWWIKSVCIAALMGLLFAGLLAVAVVSSHYHFPPRSTERATVFVSWLMTFAICVWSSILWSECYRWGSFAQAKQAWINEFRSIRRSRRNTNALELFLTRDLERIKKARESGMARPSSGTRDSKEG
jgi:hypothetical protein